MHCTPHAAFIKMRTVLLTGSWLSAGRMQRIAGMMLALSLLSLTFLLMTRNGLMDSSGRPLGSDYSEVYAAGRLAQQGHAADAYNPALHYTQQKAIFGSATPFYGWHYPPYFLLPATLLAFLPYLASLLIWQTSSFAFYLFSTARILSPLTRPEWLAVLAFPAIFINLTHGHNGFLTAGLLGSGLYLLSQNRPWAAGTLLGLLCYKPHFALMLPLALLAGRHGRTIAAASLSVMLITLLTLLFFGVESWQAFAHFSQFTRQVVLEQGDTGWYKIQSLFAATRAAGGSIALAYTLQALLTAALALWIFRSWCSGLPFAARASRLCLAAMLATPYALDYDLMILAPALAFALLHARQHGFAPWEKTFLALNWAAPFFTRAVAMETGIPLALLCMLGWWGSSLCHPLPPREPANA